MRYEIEIPVAGDIAVIIESAVHHDEKLAQWFQCFVFHDKLSCNRFG